MHSSPAQSPVVKMDLHVHSRFSKRASQWVLQKIGCPESFTEPLQIYEIAREKGMDMVTITDHNTISGALEIAHLPGTFISEEVTTYFPEDRCKIHILGYDISEKQHEDIQKARENIFDLAAYLRKEDIFHVVAHPLYSINDRLSLSHFEKLLLLFSSFEINGARDALQSHCLQTAISHLTPQTMDQLANLHDIELYSADSWKKYLTGGSDDHSGLNIGRTHTEIFSPPDRMSVLQALSEGASRVISHPSSPLTLAHNLYGIAYQFYRSKFKLERYTERDILMRFLDHSLRHRTENAPGIISRIYFYWNYRKPSRPETELPRNLVEMIRRETRNLIHDNPDMLQTDSAQEAPFDAAEQKWFRFVNQISSNVANGFASHLFGHLSGANVFDIFHTIGSAGGLYTLLAPYFVSFSHFTRDRALIQEVRTRFCDHTSPSNIESDSHIRVAHFTDTFYEVNGVARTLHQQVELALKIQKDLTIVTCDSEDRPDSNGVKNFKPVGMHELPEYPEQKIFYPPILEMLAYCYEQGFTHLHSATPGPIGLAALAIARILKLPIEGTYHTSLPQYARYLTGDSAVEDLTWKYILWYYNQMDTVYVPSRSTGDELVEKGISKEKIRLMQRGIDISLFHPSRRNGFWKLHYGIADSGIKLLYVGRVSKEKNLHILSEAFKQLLRKRSDIHLIVVGDGPYLKEMTAELKGTPIIFTGCLSGETLASAYASADIFVFPSTTDTFGNVVLEAQASGLPVIVTDQGGPQENLLDSITGIVVKGNDTDSLFQTIQYLLNHPDTRKQMGLAARKYMAERSFEDAFLKTWKMYAPVEPLSVAMAVNA